MDRLTPTIIVVAFIAVILLLMWWGWRARARRQSGYPMPLKPPESLGEELFAPLALYLSTTPAGEPLNRLVAPGLAFRAQSIIRVTESGIELLMTGQKAVFIPRDQILGIDAATLTIDRVVEKDGLVRLSWLLGTHQVDSFFRLADETERAELFRVVRLISHTPHHSQPQPKAEPQAQPLTDERNENPNGQN